jgi:hypothetical protein
MVELGFDLDSLAPESILSDDIHSVPLSSAGILREIQDTTCG